MADTSRMTKVFYNGECILMYNLDPVMEGMTALEEEHFYEVFHELLNCIHSRAYDAFDEPKLQKELDKIWEGNERLRNLGEEKYEIAKSQTENVLEWRSIQDKFMKESLSEEEYKIWDKIDREAVTFENKWEQTHLDEGKYIVYEEPNGRRFYDYLYLQSI